MITIHQTLNTIYFHFQIATHRQNQLMKVMAVARTL
jgi:hypothetical protein